MSAPDIPDRPEYQETLDQSLDKSESSDSDPLTQYTLEEVESHNKDGDRWMIYKGRVYDVSSFKHPGGLAAIQRNGGLDATEKILNEPKHRGKMERIALMLSELEIGRLIH